jgi:hypothetical protein
MNPLKHPNFPFMRPFFFRLSFVVVLLSAGLRSHAEVVTLPAPSTEAMIRRHPTMPEPLVPVAESPLAAETTALGLAIVAHDARTTSDDYTALQQFAVTYAASPWTPAVQLNLGLLYYRSGYFCRAMDEFSKAWEAARLGAAPGAETVANRAVSELAVMHARVGQQSELTALLAATATRNFQGNAKVQMDRAREGLKSMQDSPAVSFRCGPYALTGVADVLSTAVPDSFLEQVASTPQGFSLLELKTMAGSQLSMPVQVVKRALGAGVPVPSVMHLKCGHYGALVRQEGDFYLLRDPTFGNDTWMTSAAVDDECSGYFVVAAGAVPTGCTAVADAEAGTQYGKGASGDSDTGATRCGDKQTSPPCGTGMASYSIHLLRASLAVSDTPIVLPAPYGDSVALNCAYHQREADRPVNPTYSHFGLQWVSNHVSWLVENTANSAADIKVFLPGGGFETFTGYSASTKLYTRSRTSGLLLYRAAAGSYELRVQGGSKLVYQRSAGDGPVFLTSLVDAAGNVTTIQYSSNSDFPFRIHSVSAADGRTLFYFYNEAGDDFAVSDVADDAVLANAYKVVHFDYTTPTSGVKRLESITDPVGIESQFTYDPSGFMMSLTTPYGTTTFDTNIFLPRWVTATDPQNGTEKVESSTAHEFVMPKPAQLPDGVLSNTSYRWSYRNTYHWSKVMYKVAHTDEQVDDRSKAHAYGWVQKDNADFALSTLEWEKPPLQDFIWYNYPGQTTNSYMAGSAPTPTKIGTMTEDENGVLQTSVSSTTYHSVSGNVLEETDAAGLQTRYTYSSTVTGVDTVNPGTDVTKVEVFDTDANAWTTLLDVTQYDEHVPTAYTDEQGVSHARTMNDHGQLTQYTRSSTTGGSTRTETMRLYYTPGPVDAVGGWSATAYGYLRKVEVTDPANAAAYVTVAESSYDANGRLLTQKDAEGYEVTLTHDALGPRDADPAPGHDDGDRGVCAGRADDPVTDEGDGA